MLSGLNNKSLSWGILAFVYIVVIFGLYCLLNPITDLDISEALGALSKFYGQIIAVILGSLLLYGAYICDHAKLRNFLSKSLFTIKGVDIEISPLYLLCVILLIWAYLSPPKNDVHRWVDLKLFSFQPSELAKLCLISLWANSLVTNEKKLRNVTNYYRQRNVPKSIQDSFFKRLRFNVVTFLKGTICEAFEVIFCILLQPILLTVLLFVLIELGSDMGTIILMTLMIVCFLLFSSCSRRISAFLVPFLIMVVVNGYIIYSITGRIDIEGIPYRMARIIGSLRLDCFQNGINLQPAKSLQAISTGGFYGQGSLTSNFSGNFVPESHCDFIIPQISESFGLFGVACTTYCLFMIFVCCCLICIINANKNKDMFSLFVISGVGIQIILQSIINISVATAIMPNKGMPLPFISHGGSSMLVELFFIGVVLNMTKNLDKPKVQEVSKKEKAVFLPSGVTICNSVDDLKNVDLTWANLMNLHI